MRYTLMCLGSTGDVQPYLTLGATLQKRGHEITIAAFPGFEEIVVKHGFAFYPVNGDARQFMEMVMKPGAVGISYLRQTKKYLQEHIDLMMHDMQKACENAQAVVCTYFGAITYSIAEKRGIPCVQTHYFIMDENNQIPISSAPGIHWGKGWNRISYKLGYVLINVLEKSLVDQWRKEEGMPLRKVGATPDYTINGWQMPVVYAISSKLFPRPSNWEPHIHMTGFWHGERSKAYVPSPDLEKFLFEGERPIYIGFGSMVTKDMGAFLTTVIEAVEQAGVKAIISKGWSGNDAYLQKSNRVFVTDFVPHDWLFEKVAAVVHHGGAGTLAAGLRAGKPTLVIPFAGDQPFWGKQAYQMGYGPQPLPRGEVTTENLAQRLLELMQNEAYREKAYAMGVALRQEKGVLQAADIIEKAVNSWYSEKDIQDF